MAVKRKYRLNLRNYGNLPAIMLSQYDEGYALEFEIRDGTDAASDLSAYTVTLKGTRADTLAYSFAGTVSTNVLTFVIDTTMTACAGRGTAEIAIKDTANDVLFATFNMPVFVERAAVPEGSIDADVERAQEIAEQVQEIVDNAAAAVSGEAEKWATGQINGTDVPSTDPAYENNAKYYAEQAADSAASIGIDATLTQAGKAADSKKTGDEITALKEDLNDIQSATAEDVGKALKAKTVTNGKVTKWEFSDSGGDVTASPNESEKYDLAIADTSGNALVIMQNGHIKTKNFDSSEQTKTLNRLSAIESATADDEGKALIAERISNGRVEEWAFTTPGDATALQTDSQKYEFAIGDKDGNAILSVSNGHIKTKNFDSSLFVIDPTLSSGAADAKTVGYKLRSIYDMLDNIPFVHGVINDSDGKWNFDTAKKNVYYQPFFSVDDYAGIQKAPSDAYSLSIYFYTQKDQTTFVKSKTLHDVEIYYFSEEDSGYYFRIRVRSTTDSVLDLTTRYVRLFTSRKATVKHKNEDKRNALVTSKGKNQNNFSLLVVTDLHGDDVRMFNAISYLNEEDLLDAGACLGDILSQNSTFYTDAVLNAQKDFMTLIGNHDVGDGTSITTGRTQQQAFDKFIAPVVTKTGTDTTKAYYYKDYDNKKIRMIILNSSDLPDTLADESNFLVNRGLLGAFSQAQINWFISALTSTPAGYHVLILMHYVNAEMTADENLHFHTTSVTGAGRTGNAYVGIINDIVKAWKNGAALTKTYTSSYENMPIINVNADFTARGTGVFVGFLTGHVHRDVVGHFNDYPDQAACIFTLSNMIRGGEDDMPRVAGEKSEDAMTVVSVDTTNRKLYLVRVGANLAIDFTERADVCISY